MKKYMMTFMITVAIAMFGTTASQAQGQPQCIPFPTTNSSPIIGVVTWTRISAAGTPGISTDQIRNCTSYGQARCTPGPANISIGECLSGISIPIDATHSSTNTNTQMLLCLDPSMKN